MASLKPIVYGTLLNLARVLTYPLGFTPFSTVSLLLGSKLPKPIAIFYMLALVTCSDMLIATVSGWHAFGLWTLFTYSAYIFITLLGTKLAKKPRFMHLILFVGASSLTFWIWTNFGAWILSPLYSKNFAGLSGCYIAALPFLRNSLIGNFCFATIIFGIQHEKVNTWWRSLWQKQLCSKIS